LNWTKLVETKVKKVSDISKETSISKEYGNLVHYILSLIEKYPDEKLSKKIEIACKKFNYDSNLIKDKILKILENSEVKKFFTIRENDKVFIEKDIVDREGRLHRIDRFIIREDRIEVLDFKTGEEHKEEHKKQILVYRNLLKSIYPDKKIFCYLIYTDDNKIEVVQ
jgi:ATP-dependent exoDNAse (exonuclease V) beta subunit